jgi:hypothetical protein
VLAATMLCAGIVSAAEGPAADARVVAAAEAPAADYALTPLRVGSAKPKPKFLYLFGRPAKWAGALRWKYNPKNAPPGFASVGTAVSRLQAAFDQWTAGCAIRYVYDGETTIAPDHREIDPDEGQVPDYVNVVGWGPTGSSVAGQTWAWYDDDDGKNTLVDADIILNPALVGDVGAMARTGTHEWGHALGLAHSNLDGAIMSGPPYSSYDSLTVVQPDDMRGCRCLYGLPTGVQAAYVCSLPQQVNFGSVSVGATSARQSVEVKNSGNAALTLGAIATDDAQFARVAGCEPGTTLAPGAACTMQLTARPDTSGSRSTRLTMSTSEGTYRLPLLADGVAPPPPPPVPTVTAVEYYNTVLDHYFVTTRAAEQAELDAGRTPTPWVRTGLGFKAHAGAQPGTSPVCRYYIPPALGDSHFFGRGSAECDATGQRNPSFVLEDAAFMHVFLPSHGACPAGTTPVYRVFSNRADANHRYMTSPAVRDQMIAKGWLAEGDGDDRVVMCSPP